METESIIASVVSGIIALLIIISGGLWIYSAVTEEVIINGPDTVMVVYGDELSLDEFSITLDRRINISKINEDKVISVNFDMIQGYDPEIIGSQEVTIEYDGKTRDILITVEPNPLIEVLVIKTGEIISWNGLDHVSGYQVIVNGHEIIEVSEPFININQIQSEGELEVQVVALPENEKYDRSNSNIISFTRLESVLNVELNENVLSWSEVPGYSYVLYLGTQVIPLDSDVYSYELDLPTGKTNIGVQIATNDNTEANSIVQNFQITKLEKAFIRFDGETAYCTSYYNCELFVNGEAFDGYIMYLPSGTHELSAKSTVTESFTIDSDYVYKLITKLTPPQISILYDQIEYTGNGDIHYYLNGEEFDGVISDLEPGEYDISAKYLALEEDEYDSYVSNIIQITIPVPPGITMNGNIVNCDDSVYDCVYYLDESLFNGTITSLSPGEHIVKVKYVSEDNHILDSTYTYLTINKLRPPVISIYDETLYHTGEGEISYFIDNVEFDGDLSVLTPGTYEIRAIFEGQHSLEFDSELSNSLTITKLVAPTLTVGIDGLEHTSNGVIEYYNYGVEFDGEITTLPAGTYHLTAKVIGETEYQLDSDESNLIEFTRTKLPLPVCQIDNYVLTCDESLNNAAMLFDDNTFDGTINGNILTAGDHEIKVWLQMNGITEINSDPITININKPSAPVIDIVDEEITYTNTGSIQYFIDDVIFDGDLSNLTPGSYQITAKFLGTGTTVVDSDISNTVTVTKLSEPVLSVNNEMLEYTGTGTIEYLKNGVVFDGDLQSLAPGTYYITSRFIASNNLQLKSEYSNTLTITKLPTPIIQMNGEEVDCDDTLYTCTYYLDDVVFNGTLTHSELTSGEHVIEVAYTSTNTYVIDSDKAIITITKLQEPTIDVLNDNITYTGTETIQYYLNGVEFDGDILNLLPGTYNITAKFISQNDTEFDSELSNSIEITKLSAPIISITDDTVNCDSSTYTCRYLIEEVEFNGTIPELTDGTHTIKVQYTDVDNYLISSDYSVITIEKLTAPTVTFDGANLSHTGVGTIQYYLDGVAFDGDLSSLDFGVYEITGQFIGQNNEEFDSDISTVLTLQKIDYNLYVQQTTLNRILILWDDFGSRDHSLRVEFYFGGWEIDEVIYTGLTGTTKYTTYIRDGVTADYVRIYLEVDGDIYEIDSTMMVDILIN